MEDLNKKRLNDYESLKVEADRLTAQYERENKSAGDMAQSLKGQLSMEQKKNAESIAKLQADLKAKGAEMSQLQTTTNERSRTIAELKSKLDAYRIESERAIEDSKKQIASMGANFERELARGKTSHQAQLDQLEKKLQGDIERLQGDLTSRSNMIADLRTRLDESSASSKKLSGEIIGLETARRSTESLLRQSSQNLDAARQEVELLKEQLQVVKRSDATNTAKIQGLERELQEKAALVNRLQSGSEQFASDKSKLINDLNSLRLWQDSAQATIKSLSNEVALSAVSKEIAQSKDGMIDNVIEKLSSIRNDLKQKDVELNYTKSATDALLKKQQVQPKPSGMGNMIETRSSPAASVGGGTDTGPSVNVIGGGNVIGAGFGTRRRNVAIVRENKFQSAPIVTSPQRAPPAEPAQTVVVGATTSDSESVAVAVEAPPVPEATVPVTPATPLQGAIPERSGVPKAGTNTSGSKKSFGFGGGAKWKTEQPSSAPAQARPATPSTPKEGSSEPGPKKYYGLGGGSRWKSSKRSGGGGYLDNMSP